MPISLPEAQKQLTSWLAASEATATGQSYTINGRTLSRVNSSEIIEQIQYWSRVESSLLRIQNGKSGIGHSLARFN